MSTKLKEELCKKLIKGGYLRPYNTIRHSYTRSRLSGRITSKNNDLCPTLDTRCDCIGVAVPMIYKTKNKRIQKLVESTNFEEKDTLYMDIYNQKTLNNISGTLKCGMDSQQGNIIYNNLRIRKLTPKECWRLMGFDDEDFEKAKAVPMSNTQLYKQAGNSIVVNVIEEIYKCLFKGSENNE